jgi:hypothetical protein
MPDPRDKMILGLFGDLEKNGHNIEPQIEVFEKDIHIFLPSTFGSPPRGGCRSIIAKAIGRRLQNWVYAIDARKRPMWAVSIPLM